MEIVQPRACAASVPGRLIYHFRFEIDRRHHTLVGFRLRDRGLASSCSRLVPTDGPAGILTAVTRTTILLTQASQPPVDRPEGRFPRLFCTASLIDAPQMIARTYIGHA